MSAAAGTLAVRYISILAYMERFAGDLRTAVLLPAEPQHPEIIIVAITEETLEQFPYRSPIDRHFLSDVLKLLAARSVRAILLDVLFDQPTEPEKDQLLRQTLEDLSVPLVVTYVRDPQIVTERQRRFLDAFVPPRLRALGNVASDPVDDTVRWIYPGARTSEGDFIPGVAYVVAAKAGVQREPRQLEIAWRGRPNAEVEPFRAYPAHVIAALPPEWFKDKIVLIGADLSITDRHRTPFAAVLEGNNGSLPGIVIDAEAIAQLLDNRSVRKPVPQLAFALVLAIAVIGALLGAVDIGPLARFGAAIVFVIAAWVGGFALFHHNRIELPLVAPTLAFGLAISAMDSLGGRLARRQREFIKSAFSRYVSPKIVSELIRNPEALALRGERRDVTLLFTDVAAFTSMAEAIDSEELGPLMNSYFDGICRIVLKYDGTVDKFIGDAVFAIFNAPVEQPDHAERAVKCALDINRFARAFCVEQRARSIDFGITRVGVHTGRALVGNFGSTARMEYTALGDVVNTAARLEGINKVFGSHICASDATRAACTSLRFRPLGRVLLRGKTTPITVFEPLASIDVDAGYVMRYHEAYGALERGDEHAGQLFDLLARERPEDACVAFHRARIARGVNGIEVVSSEK